METTSEKLSFRVAEFDAPLDLILHLISKHKLNIHDIEISALLAQYLAYIEGMRQRDLDVASEFLEMASRLVYMKTVSLLPRHEEEDQRLRRELTGQLLEYRLCQAVAMLLGQQNISQQIFVRQPLPIPQDTTYSHMHEPQLLFRALTDAMGKGVRRRPPSRESFEPLVSRPVVSVTAKIFMVLRALRHSSRLGMDKLYAGCENRSGMVATFLALLELIKSQRVRVEENMVVPGTHSGKATKEKALF